MLCICLVLCLSKQYKMGIKEYSVSMYMCSDIESGTFLHTSPKNLVQIVPKFWQQLFNQFQHKIACTEFQHI